MKFRIKKSLLKYLFFGFSLIVFYYGHVQGIPSLMFYPMLFVMLYFDINIVFIDFMYMAVVNLTEFSLQGLVTSFLVMLIITFCYILKKTSGKKYSIYSLLFCYVISQVVLIYKNFSPEKIISVCLGAIFFVCLINYFRSFFKKGNITHFTFDQNICGGVILVCYGLGLSQMPFNQFIFKFVGTFVILFFVFVYDRPVSVIVAVLLGSGYAVNYDTTYLFYFSLFAVFCYGFRWYNKIVSLLSGIIAEILLAMFFNIYGVYTEYNFISTLLAICLFFVFSNRIISFGKLLMGENKLTFGVKSLVNRSREQMCYKMNELSSVFSEMHRQYYSMVNGYLSGKELYDNMVSSIAKNMCENCKRKNICFSMKEKDSTVSDFKLMLTKGIEKGSINVLDLPGGMNYRCDRLSQMINFTNNLILNYKEYKVAVKNSDMSKLLVAEQLKGVSSLLSSLGAEIGKAVLFNNSFEEKLREELSYIDVLCDEVLYYEVGDDANISLVMPKNSIIDTMSTQNVISKVIKRSFSFVKQYEGFYGDIFEFRPEAKFGYAFGASGKGKERISGDTFSFTKINNYRVMFAICDGMGTGEGAQSISETSINLIENFYKAGYDSQIVLSSVNKLLSVNGQENYSAIDIVVLDLNEGYSNFIKLGAPDSIIKTSEGIIKIKSGALPLGILEEAEPVILERNLNLDDMICMFSDGIVDAFKSIENLIEFIDGLKITNPQMLSDKILAEALALNNSPDDKTVICVRIFKNY